MRVCSVNVSPLVSRPKDGGVITTGVFKRPVTHPVAVRMLGLEGDAQADLKHHGGVHKAVYAYTLENLARWREELGRPELAPGAMGENLTTEGLDEADVCVGDRFRIGTAILEVSEPRTPCSTLAMAMDDTSFPKTFLASGRTGFYLRVIAEGSLAAGQLITRLEREESGPRIPVGEVSRLMHRAPEELEGARRCLQIGSLGPTWRERFARRLQASGPL